ncbi:MAG: hypothetical protein GWO23_01690, partial [Gammaproteobacteria bacterium]|nr:hypothetical protein [Gammaproteobacteria bacterium]
EGARERNISAPRTENFESVTGKGVMGTIDGQQAALGNRALLDQLGIDPFPLLEKAEEMRRDGQTA